MGDGKQPIPSLFQFRSAHSRLIQTSELNQKTDPWSEVFSARRSLFKFLPNPVGRARGSLK